MSSNAQLLSGIAIELALLAFAWLRWFRAPSPNSGLPRTWPGRFVLIAGTTGGFGGAPFWWMDLPDAFSWDLPLLASRMLGVAGLAFGVTGLLVLERPSSPRTRLFMVMMAIYLLPLGLAAVFLHLDRYDFSRPITPVFFAVVAVLSLGALWELLVGRRTASLQLRPGDGLRLFLGTVGSLLLVWAVALFAAPATPVGWLFVWPRDPLTSRLIAAMLLTLGLALLLSRGDRGRARLSLSMAVIYGIGVAAAVAINLANGKSAPLFYACSLLAVALGSIACMIVETKRRQGEKKPL